MNKCMIFYVSQHHHNTERLLKQAIDKESGVELVPLSHAACPVPDLSDTACSSLSRSAAFPTAPLLPSPASCPLIGLASGIYMGKPHTALLSFLEQHRKELAGRKVFLLLTSGSGMKKYAADFSSLTESFGCRVQGCFQCKGYDTYGPWKLMGGIAKGRPDASDISRARAFIQEQLRGLPSEGSQ